MGKKRKKKNLDLFSCIHEFKKINKIKGNDSNVLHEHPGFFSTEESILFYKYIRKD